MLSERAVNWFAANARVGGNVFSSRATGIKSRNLKKSVKHANP